MASILHGLHVETTKKVILQPAAVVFILPMHLTSVWSSIAVELDIMFWKFQLRTIYVIVIVHDTTMPLGLLMSE